MAYTKRILSGDTNGEGVTVAATSSPGTTIHTATSDTDDDNFDEVYLWASNPNDEAYQLTIEWAGTAATNARVYNIPANEPWHPIAGELRLPLNNAKVVKAYADTASKIIVNGYAHRNV